MEKEKEDEELKQQKSAAMLLDDDEAFSLSWGAVMSGELLGGAWMRHQVKFIALILVLTVLYVTNRYSAEQELIEIADSRRELQDIKYRSLTCGSELTMRTRQSMIEEALNEAGDSTLKSAKEPPFVISISHAGE